MTDADGAAIPVEEIAEAERLTGLARAAVDPGEAERYRERRDRRLLEYGFVARVRSEPDEDVLVLYPAEWVDEGTVRVDRIDDLSRAIERPLTAGRESHSWETIDEWNRTVVERVRRDHGRVHGATAAALADFMGNHYRKRIAAATPGELEEFRNEYFVRNAWPSDEQKASLERSLELVFEAMETDGSRDSTDS